MVRLKWNVKYCRTCGRVRCTDFCPWPLYKQMKQEERGKGKIGADVKVLKNMVISGVVIFCLFFSVLLNIYIYGRQHRMVSQLHVIIRF
jgi:hypothetical protein